jgi:3-methyladenine DNA glycosylase AlkD
MQSSAQHKRNSRVSGLTRELNSLASPEIARRSQRFFKTGKGEYGEGDKFLGIRVPALRKVAKKYRHLNLQEVTKLLKSPFHEIRLLSLFILVAHYEKASEHEKREIVNLYLDNTKFINNWDLVDSSAHKILGDYLLSKDKLLLYRLASSTDIWERRIAIIATAKFISKDFFNDTIRLSECLLNDEEDLIHKAVGWMLREVGKRNLEAELDFLDSHAREMPRTMLRYAIEKFPKSLKQDYMAGISSK